MSKVVSPLEWADASNDPSKACAVPPRGPHTLDSQRAVRDLTDALGRDPDNPEILYNRGFAYEAMGLTAEAVADYRHALRDPRADRLAILDSLDRCDPERIDK